MFDKKAEEIANKRCHEIMCYGHCSFNSPKHHRCGEWHREYNCAKEGIEYGYSQANEWHYVKDGDLPTHTRQVLVYLKSDDVDIDCYGKCLGWKNHLNEQIKAWKEIVLPKRSKEI